MNALRKLIQLPFALVHTALVMYSHRTLWLRRARDVGFGAAFVVALAVLVVYVAGRVGVVPY